MSAAKADWIPPVELLDREEKIRPNDRYHRNDTGNGDRLAAAHGADLIYCEERKNLMVYTGSRWEHDEFIRAERLAEETLLQAFSEASHFTDSAERKAFVKFLEQSLGRSGIANMVHAVKRKVRMASINDFDANPYLLNCRNGTVDLITGQLRGHQREDMVTKRIPIDYIDRAECPGFQRFLHRIMGGNPDADTSERTDTLIAYLQRLLGCAATGVPEKLLIIFYGSGNNGKTTLVELVRSALGKAEYAGEIHIETLLASIKEAGSNAANADLADLKGRRFVSSSEPERSRKLSLGRVKYLTGLGQVRARYLAENFFNFNPTHKLFLDCNHKPVVTDPDDAVWNRVKLIPFSVKIPDSEIDVNLLDKLKPELPGILRWIVAGAAAYCRHGIGPTPSEVTDATESYRQESDRLKDFIEDKCSIGDPTSWTPVANLYPAYAAYAESTGEKYPLSKSAFDERLVALGCTKGRDPRGTVRVWKGIRFQS